MKPDIDEYYNIEQAALFKAGIDPSKCCNRIEIAVERTIEGYRNAEDYFYYLKDKIETVNLEKQDEVDVHIYHKTMAFPAYKHFILGKDLLEWCEMEVPVITESLNDRGCVINRKSENTYKKLIKSLLKLVMIYETGQSKPGYFNGPKNILKQKGDLNFNALKELLIEIDPDTPPSANKIMSESMNQD